VPKLKQPIQVDDKSDKRTVMTVVNRLFARRESGLFLLLILICFIMSVLKPDTFFTSENAFNILRQVSIIAIIAVGQTFVMISGGIDLSIGYNLALCGIVISTFLQMGFGPILSIIMGIIAGALVGFLNGIIITKLRLPPFIATLGMANIARGIIYIITQGFSISVDNPIVIGIGVGNVASIPILSIIMFVIVLIGIYVLDSTVFGTRVKAIGGNELASKLSGIKVHHNKIAVYTMTGVLAAIGGLIMVGRLYAGNPNAGANFEMDSIAATIVGGTSLSGGQGTVVGALLGSLLLAVIKNSLVLLSVNMYWQTVAVGVIIIIVCAIDGFTRVRRA